MLRAAIIAIAVFSLPCSALAVDYVQGIDVSRWQGDINWTAVKNAGINFAFAKATEGVDFVDIKFHQNVAGAKAAGVLFGPYHFGRPDSFENDPMDAVKEADDFVDEIAPYYQTPGLMLRPVLDLERLPNDPVTPTIKAFLSQWVRDFNGRVTNRLGVAPIIYTTRGIAQQYLEPDLAQYPLWLAKPAATNVFEQAPPPTSNELGIWTDWTFWQWTHTGNIGGINPVDRNVFQGTMQQLGQFAPNFYAGDYNSNGVVDAADYILWRKTMGQSIRLGLGADGNLSGVIDAGDFNVWRANLGRIYGSGSSDVVGSNGSGSTPTPEPPGAWLLVIGMIACLTARDPSPRVLYCR